MTIHKNDITYKFKIFKKEITKQKQLIRKYVVGIAKLHRTLKRKINFITTQHSYSNVKFLTKCKFLDDVNLKCMSALRILIEQVILQNNLFSEWVYHQIQTNVFFCACASTTNFFQYLC